WYACLTTLPHLGITGSRYYWADQNRVNPIRVAPFHDFGAAVNGCRVRRWCGLSADAAHQPTQVTTYIGAPGSAGGRPVGSSLLFSWATFAGCLNGGCRRLQFR